MVPKTENTKEKGLKTKKQYSSEKNRNTTTTTTVLWPFVPDYPGEPVPEEKLSHPPS